MKVDTISETQTQFKGLFVLKNAMKESEHIAQKAVPAELVSLEPLIDNYNAAAKTLLQYAGEKFQLKLPFDKVLESYKKVAFKNDVIELDGGFENASVSSPFYPG